MIQYKEGQLASLSIELSQVISYYQLTEHRVQLILYSRRTENVLVTLNLVKAWTQLNKHSKTSFEKNCYPVESTL